MVFVIIWFLDHFTLEYIPSMNRIWIITSASLFHVWQRSLRHFLYFWSCHYWHRITLYGWASLLFFLMKHNTLSKHPRQATCLFFMRSSVSSLRLKCLSVDGLVFGCLFLQWLRLIFEPPVAKLLLQPTRWKVWPHAFYNAGESNKAQVLLTRLHPCAAGKYLPPDLARALRLQNAACTC